MKVLVTGVKGQLGYDTVNELKKRGHTPIGVDIEEMDITDSASVNQVIKEAAPDAVIHCAAWTAVDAAEDEANQEKVMLVNGTGTQNIANVCKELGIKMMYISTDYVFDGQGETPWEPDCKDYKPLNVYGKSKLAGELAVSETLSKYFIVRIAWVFGLNGNNFIKTMLKVGKNHDKLTVVNDQIHATNEGGYISWYDFATEIFRQAYEIMGEEEYSKEHLTVAPVTTAEYGISKAARPFNSRLDKSKLTANSFALLPTWQDALNRYLKDLKTQE